MSDLRIEKLNMESTDITQENINKIIELFPQVVTEGKIDFDVLKTILGEQIENQNERYQFTWNGKSDTIRFAQKPSTGTLRPDKESSKNWDTTENLYIEGDNLEVLKLLQKTYHNKIKMIYIDPPYNTGGDFVYKDDFKDSIKNYKEQTNQTLRTNPETSGRYHTDWLNMMYSRLMLAKNLLTEDGVIFISIDDVELENLKKIGNEIFGENNYIGCFLWKKKSTSTNVANVQLSPQVDYNLTFAKNIESLPINRRVVLSETRNYPFLDEFGYYRKAVIEKKDTGEYARESMKFPIMGVTPREGKRWQIGAETARILESKNRFIIEEGIIKLKIYKEDDKDTYSAQPNLLTEYGTTDSANKETNSELLRSPDLFSNPKPVKLIKHFTEMGSTRNTIVLDFFSGSSTTAHAVMQLNAEDGGNRKFIMVQLPEKTEEKSEAFKAGYNNICEIGKERIRRAGEKIKNELVEKNQKAGMLEVSVDPDKLDIGFKVYKLDSSNFNVFDSSSKDIDNIFSHDVFLSGRSKLDILYEILLKYGVFDKPVEVLNINNKEAYSVAFGHMLVYINQEITEQDITEVVALKPREVIIDERGFKTDNDKMNAVIRLEAAGVEKISTI